MKIRITLVGLFCIAALNFSVVPSVAKDWGGIVLLVSTCEDVKRILNVTTCKAPWSYYPREKEVLVVSYAETPCGKGKVDENTPAKVVTAITRNLRNPVPFSDFGINKSEYSEFTNDFIGYIQYSNDAKGISFRTVDGMVNSIDYYPSKEERRKRCRR